MSVQGPVMTVGHAHRKVLQYRLLTEDMHFRVVNMTTNVATSSVAIRWNQRPAAPQAMAATQGLMTTRDDHHNLLSIKLLRDICPRGPHL